MKTRLIISIVLLLVCSVTAAEMPIEQPPAPLIAKQQFRPPAVPLVACDPYFSIWSFADKLTDDVTRHWTGRPHPLTCLARIDGKTYRVMGIEPEKTPAMEQINLKVWPTMTTCVFRADGVEMTLTFFQPALPNDIDMMSRPVTFVSIDTTYYDNQEHKVSVYFDAGMDIAVNDPDQMVKWGEEELERIKVLQCGSDSQQVLGRKGDNVRIDWGHFYMATQEMYLGQSVIAPAADCRGMFVEKGKIPETVDADMPRAVNDNAPVMAMTFDDVFRKKLKIGLFYDDEYSVLYFGQKLQPYWRRNGMDAIGLIRESFTDDSTKNADAIRVQCEGFNIELLADVARAGGREYVLIASLAYRQALGANKIVADKNGMPLMFSKENFSNGCMGTVDVFYPFAPQVLLLNPTLAKASFVPILEYGRSDRWKFPFAPHDIGQYPHAMGQVYGGGENSADNQMPVEECGNMILLVAATVEAENDIAFARQYWDVLTVWAKYLKSKGLDPENQLCTDDFAGHLAHNVNLSVKAIVALGAYAKMADMMGEKETAAEYRKTAEGYVKRWLKMADDGDHYRLAFDKPGTWSQKYNLVWDRVLGLDLFPAEVSQKEMAYYLTKQNTYGLPLDNRSKYTKLDWILWTACITGQRSDFEELVKPVYRFLNETPDRVPMTDWYWTHDARVRGFQARPVVGGVFMKLLDNKATWGKWVLKAGKVEGQWQPTPKRPKINVIVPTSAKSPAQWAYTLTDPGVEWYETFYDDSKWKKGLGGFGTANTPGAKVRTIWNGRDIWLRREINLKEVPVNPHLLMHHDEGADVFINGFRAGTYPGYTTRYETLEISGIAAKSLKPGKNLIAIRCSQTTGGQYIDAGLCDVIEQE